MGCRNHSAEFKANALKQAVDWGSPLRPPASQTHDPCGQRPLFMLSCSALRISPIWVQPTRPILACTGIDEHEVY